LQEFPTRVHADVFVKLLYFIFTYYISNYENVFVNTAVKKAGSFYIEVMKKCLPLIIVGCLALFQLHCTSGRKLQTETYTAAAAVLRAQVLAEAAWAMLQQPVTITTEGSPRSAGGRHDFFSEADYFWPDPKNPDGPYINRDGITNPDNFLAHRKAMIRLSRIIGALASAYKLTGDEKYVVQAVVHLKAWFINEDTYMNPNLQFSQAVKGLFTGRNFGIIDTIHLMEVAQGVLVMESAKSFDPAIASGVKKWFAQYNTWLNTSKMGLDEKHTKNNHSTCWAMQVASFAKLCGDNALLDTCRNLYKHTILPNQMGVDGSFPLELARTKPYGYSLFNLDAMAALCQIASDDQYDLWKYTTPDGRSIGKAIEYLYPFVKDKSAWTYKPDVMYWLETWKMLEHDPKVDEVIRNLPLRHPLIWI
jgi:hypothetical protein